MRREVKSALFLTLSVSLGLKSSITTYLETSPAPWAHWTLHPVILRSPPGRFSKHPFTRVRFSYLSLTSLVASRRPCWCAPFSVSLENLLGRHHGVGVFFSCFSVFPRFQHRVHDVLGAIQRPYFLHHGLPLVSKILTLGECMFRRDFVR